MKIEPGRVYCGDNLPMMRGMGAGTVDLIYADPPFNTGNDFKAFSDRFEGIDGCLRWLVPRLRQMHRLLKPTGVLCVHLDYRMSHYIKVALDEIFGVKNPAAPNTSLVNEIIWHYTNSGGRGKTRWARKHDTILIYSKSESYFFDGTRNGQKRQAGKTSRGGRIYKENGKTYQQIWSNKKSYTYCLSEDRIADDVWSIQPIPPHSPERVKGDYPTQKPLTLLNRIIECLTNPGDLVADFFCGCGTTIVAAQNLNRKWIGMDISPEACKLTEDRLSGDN